MGYKAKNKQAPPRPLPGSVEPGKKRRRDTKGKKRASAPANERSAIKSGGRHRPVIPGKKRRKVDEVEEDDDSDFDEALEQG